MPARTAPSAPPPMPPSLSFPRPIFAALSPHPFLAAHLQQSKSSLRANGRQPTEPRTPQVNTGSLTHCNGSAVVRLGNTVAVCGVRAEILKVESGDSDEVESKDDSDEADYEVEQLGLLVPNIELSTGSTPSLIPGNAPSAVAQTLITRIRNLLLSSRLVRSRDLRIMFTPPSSAADDMEEDLEETKPQIKAYWTLYIDTLFISLDGNAFDAAWIAILAALRDTKLPGATYDIDFETILADDDPAAARKLELRGLPVPLTFAVLEAPADEASKAAEARFILSDPDAFEESICKETVCVVVDGEGGEEAVIRKVEKSGGRVVERGVLKGLVERAAGRWGIVRDVLGA